MNYLQKTLLNIATATAITATGCVNAPHYYDGDWKQKETKFYQYVDKTNKTERKIMELIAPSEEKKYDELKELNDPNLNIIIEQTKQINNLQNDSTLEKYVLNSMAENSNLAKTEHNKSKFNTRMNKLFNSLNKFSYDRLTELTKKYEQNNNDESTNTINKEATIAINEY